jgi:hypothetical protein
MVNKGKYLFFTGVKYQFLREFTALMEGGYV